MEENLEKRGDSFAAARNPPLNRILTVEENLEIARDTFLLSLSDPARACAAEPGQFLMVSIPDRLDPFLPRPFAVFDVAGHSLRILYKKVGRGTRLLAQCRRGDPLRVLGPLGNSYREPAGPGSLVALAGGIGLASLHLLLKRLLQRDRAVHLLYGVRSRQDLVPLEALAARGLKLSVAAEDGSRGFRGTVCELFQSLWGEGPGSAAAPSFSYACGPPAMLQQAAVLLRGRGIPCQVSVEARMACGFGVCQGCVIKARGMGDPQEVVYRKVCVDGPVFDADSVMWEPPA